MYKNLKHMALLLTITQAEIGVTVVVGLGAEKTYKMTLEDEVVTSIGQGPGYSQVLLKNAIKDRLVRDHSDDYDYRDSKLGALPKELHNNTLITVSCVKGQRFCEVTRWAGDPTMKEVYFPTIRLTLVISCDDVLTYGGHYLSDFSDQNFQILCSSKHLTVGDVKISPITNLILNEKSVEFFHKIRGMFRQHPEFEFKQLYRAIKLAGIPCDDSDVPADVKAYEADTPAITEYLRSVGLLPA